MSSELKTYRLDEICSRIIDGKHGDCKNEPGSGFYFLSAKDVINGEMCYTNARQIARDDFIESNTRTRLEPYDILFTNSGTIGRMAIVPEDKKTMRTTFQKSVAILKPNRSMVDPHFLYYLLLADNDRLSEFAGGTTQKNLLLCDLRQFTVLTPSLCVQKSIAAILKALDDKISLNRQMNKTLEDIARTIFNSWFIDFDPVRAKSEGRQPVGMSSESADLFPDCLTDDNNSILPNGWVHKTVGDLCDLNADILTKIDIFSEIRYVEISAVDQGTIKEIAIHQRGLEPSRARRKLRHGDTVLSTVRPERMAYFLALEPEDNLIASTGFAVISPVSVPWSFIHAALTQPEVFVMLGSLADGGAYPAISPAVITAIQLALPKDRIIVQVFHDLVSPLYELAHHNRIESRYLEQLRDFLLPKLLSGELHIKEAEKQLEEVL